ncbi:hypothetical protein ID866_10707 [Astraeus odoratus]|nr:hypothetical protein ID866_10707 [Astraeus odoratus]
MAKGKLTTCKPCHKVKVSCSWLKAARGVTQKWRRMQSKEDNGDNEDDEDNEAEGEGDFMVPLALTQEHRDMLSTLMMTLSALLKEFKGKANTLKVKELKATTKGKEKVAEVLEESLESSNEEEEIEDGNEGGVTKGEGDNGDGDMEMGAVPLASAM